MTNRTATKFMLRAIQEWGQPESERIAAVQDLLREARFDATSTCFPVFGGIWKSACAGPDGEAATVWLQNLTDNLRRGEFNSEVRQIELAIADRAQS